VLNHSLKPGENLILTDSEDPQQLSAAKYHGELRGFNFTDYSKSQACLETAMMSYKHKACYWVIIVFQEFR